MKTTTKSANGTSFYGTIVKTTINNIIKNCGKPRYAENTGRDKVNYDFVFETESGDVFTIYDWKEYRPINGDEVIEFHIGGMNRTVCEEALEELERLL